MNKTNLILTSLVAAIPGVVVAALLVMVFLNYGGGHNTMFQVSAALALVIGALMAAMPLGILVFYGRGAGAETMPERGAEEEPAVAEDVVEEDEIEVDELAVTDAELVVTDAEIEAVEDDDPFADAFEDEPKQGPRRK